MAFSARFLCTDGTRIAWAGLGGQQTAQATVTSMIDVNIPTE
ncbi:MAG: hypothetical protein OXC93_05055 [Rhodospirillaceae bacterium]|nr:hypothetical protein [Rhodospirillaceae bacterium]